MLSSTARQQRPTTALSGQDFPENVHEMAKVPFREETSRGHSGAGRVRDREQELEAGLQSRGAGEDREQPELAARQQETETFQRRLCKVC